MLIHDKFLGENYRGYNHQVGRVSLDANTCWSVGAFSLPAAGGDALWGTLAVNSQMNSRLMSFL